MKGVFCMAVAVWFWGAGVAWAMPIKAKMLKPRAYFQEADNGLLEALDLKSKTLKFTQKDFDQCGLNLVRRAQTMTYSCTLAIPVRARISKLQKLVSEPSEEVVFGGTKRAVSVQISPDARALTVITAFDPTGIDFEISKFNDDFFKVYDKVALLVISDALSHHPVKMEVLESR
jgi:hypothetical protein